MGGVFLQGGNVKAGVFFCKKKWTFPPENETKLMLDLFFYFKFYLFVGMGVRTHPTGLTTDRGAVVVSTTA